MAQSGVYRPNLAGPIVVGLFVATFAAAVLWLLSFVFVFPEGITASGVVRLEGSDWWRITLSWLCSGLPFGESMSRWADVPPWAPLAQRLVAATLYDPFLFRMRVDEFGAGAAGFLAFFANAKTSGRHRVGWVWVRGRRLREGYEAVMYASHEFRRDMIPGRNPPGLFLAPGVQMDLARETETFTFYGAPGSGKTQWFRYMFTQIIDRGNRAAEALAAGAPLDSLRTYPDKAIILDVKGDVCERWPGDDVMLLAPHDTGLRKGPGGDYRIGVAWDVGRDIVGPPAAKDMAVQIIAESTDPIWADAAREILTGFIIGLQISRGTEWGWGDLRAVMEAPAKRQKEFLQRYYPVAAGYYILTKAGPNRTTASYLANINAKVYPLVLALALGWGSDKDVPKISLRDWVLNPTPGRRMLIMQMSGNVEAVSAAWIRAVISFMAAFVKSPEVPESDQRRIWWGLDEFPQVAQKGDGFLKVIEVGRSKGFCALVGAQVKSQFEEAWSQSQMETMEAMTRTPMLFRTGAGSIADYLAEKVVGWVEWRARDHSVSVGTDTSRSYSTSIERELTIQPNYFQAGLGKFKRGRVVRRGGGVYALYVGARDACRLEVPFSDWGKRREGIRLALWVFDARTLQRTASEADIEAIMRTGGGGADAPDEEAAVSPGAAQPEVAFSLFAAPPGLAGGATGLSRLQAQDPNLFNRIMASSPGAPRPGDGPAEGEEDDDD